MGRVLHAVAAGNHDHEVFPHLGRSFSDKQVQFSLLSAARALDALGVGSLKAQDHGIEPGAMSGPPLVAGRPITRLQCAG
jgi:hypothetical protein